MAPSILHGPVIGGASAGQTSNLVIPSTTAGNCVYVAVGAWNALAAETVAAVKLGGVAGNFARSVSQVNTTGQHAACEIWANPNCAGGQTAVQVTTTGGTATNSSAIVFAWEAPGIVTSSPLDRSSGTPGTAASWSSGSTPTTTQADELLIGLFVGTDAAGQTVTGPGSPWTTTAMQSVAIAGVTAGYAMAATQVVSAAGAYSFAGTQSHAGMAWAAVIATFKAGAAPPAAANTGAFFPFYR
jgi:hypothetical protein